MLGKNVTHPQVNNSNNNIISIKDWLVLVEITESDLSKVMQSMNNNKSAGLDDISPYILKVCLPHNNTPQCFYYRRHITDGILQTAYSIHIEQNQWLSRSIKKGTKENANNDRPITFKNSEKK